MSEQKKITTSKLILYIFIICVMLFGTGFFLYKNHTLTSSEKGIIMEIPGETGLQPTGESDIKESGSSSVKFKNILQKQTVIDLNLLFDPKFKELRENYSPTGDFKAGKKNPFAP